MIEVHDIPREALRGLPYFTDLTQGDGRFLLVQRFQEDALDYEVFAIESAPTLSRALVLHKMRRAKEFWDCYVLERWYGIEGFVPSQMEIWRVTDGN